MILSCFAFTANQPSAVSRHAEIVAKSDSLGARFHRCGSFSDPQPGEIFCGKNALLALLSVAEVWFSTKMGPLPNWS
jgi:hypothetical protein